MVRIFFLSVSAAPPAAPLWATPPRLAKVPLPGGETWVSVWNTSTRSSGTPRRSATSCAAVVACPCPWDGKER